MHFARFSWKGAFCENRAPVEAGAAFSRSRGVENGAKIALGMLPGALGPRIGAKMAPGALQKRSWGLLERS